MTDEKQRPDNTTIYQRDYADPRELSR